MHYIQQQLFLPLPISFYPRLVGCVSTRSHTHVNVIIYCRHQRPLTHHICASIRTRQNVVSRVCNRRNCTYWWSYATLSLLQLWTRASTLTVMCYRGEGRCLFVLQLPFDPPPPCIYWHSYSVDPVEDSRCEASICTRRRHNTGRSFLNTCLGNSGHFSLGIKYSVGIVYCLEDLDTTLLPVNTRWSV